MTHISLIVDKLLTEMRHRAALPDMAVSLLESCIDDGEIPDEQTMRNIHSLIQLEGFPEEQKWRLIALLAQIHRRPTTNV